LLLFKQALQPTALFINNGNINFVIPLPPAANIRTEDFNMATLWVLIQLLNNTKKTLNV
jgi:hypothetical protein